MVAEMDNAGLRDIDERYARLCHNAGAVAPHIFAELISAAALEMGSFEISIGQEVWPQGHWDRPRRDGGATRRGWPVKPFFMTMTGAFLAVALLGPAAALSGQVTLTSEGTARSVIVVPEGSMAEEASDYEHERQRASFVDLARYLGRMAGTEIEIVEAVRPGDERTPIYIGAAAEAVFGPVGISYFDRFGFRVVADERGVGLYGESAFGTSYAIYELLHRLGCRWFMPSEMGEVVPDMPTIAIAEVDDKLAPATAHRTMQGRVADPDFVRRNRMSNSPLVRIRSNHGLERYYITAEQREQNAEWRLHIDGEPQGNRLRWTRQDVADAIADAIIRRLDRQYASSMTLSPGDSVVPTEDTEERKHDPEPRVWEPAANRWSVTDRLYMLANRVAERVGEQYPDVKFGLLAYVNFSMPPAREPVHPNVIPVIAPIDFNRHHPMTWENHPNEKWLLELVQGWAEKTDRISYYAYGMNLAEITAPNPFITKWGTDIPILLDNNVVYWEPEFMGGWESMLPGYYLAIRLTFDPTEDPDAILDDLWTRFYGAAAEPMGQYWRLIDRAWIETAEYSGAGFGYLRMFPPSVMREARSLIDQALALCEIDTECDRVRLIDESLTLFELFMKMRENFAAARLDELADDMAKWRAMIGRLRDQYQPQYAFDSGRAERYVNRLHGEAYEDASRMERKYTRHGSAMLEWKYRHNPGPESDAQPWIAADYNDSEWPTTHIVRETWSTIGHHNTITDEPSGRSGRIAYRASQDVGQLPEDQRAFLWIGSTDGSAKLFVNGTHIPYVTDDGEERDAFSGFARPAQFDVTDALRAGENQFTILSERTRLNEVGTGGLMGPVILYREN
jgi:hypothetical protein